MSRPLGFVPSTSGNLVPSLATDSALTYVQFPTSSFFEIGPLCWAQTPEAPTSIRTAKAAAIDLFMAFPSSSSLYPLPFPGIEMTDWQHGARLSASCLRGPYGQFIEKSFVLRLAVRFGGLR